MSAPLSYIINQRPFFHWIFHNLSLLLNNLILSWVFLQDIEWKNNCSFHSMPVHSTFLRILSFPPPLILSSLIKTPGSNQKQNKKFSPFRAFRSRVSKLLKMCVPQSRAVQWYYLCKNINSGLYEVVRIYWIEPVKVCEFFFLSDVKLFLLIVQISSQVILDISELMSFTHGLEWSKAWK